MVELQELIYDTLFIKEPLLMRFRDAEKSHKAIYGV